MADLICRGMVIRTVDYRDNDRILTLFTAESGRVDAKARNCRKATSPLLGCTQPFTYGEYQLFYHKNKYIIDQGEVLESFYPLREDRRGLPVRVPVSRRHPGGGAERGHLFPALSHPVLPDLWGQRPRGPDRRVPHPLFGPLRLSPRHHPVRRLWPGPQGGPRHPLPSRQGRGGVCRLLPRGAEDRPDGPGGHATHASPR